MDGVARTPRASHGGAMEAGADLLGKYHLGPVLGRGSFAKVHIAKTLRNDDVVAVKIIDKKKTIKASMEPRIIREVSAMRKLHHHPNILKIHEVMATKSKIYLVMEFASGGELFSKLLRRGRLPEPVARRYFQQLASALSFCHRNGVAHRDVKPQNLLLDANGNLKVSDFGLSALPEQIKDDGLLRTACGTPAYTAPEVLARKGYDGAKADAWSCGVILYVLLAGYVPFDDSNLVTMYRKILKRDYRFPDWISKAARYVIYRMLDPNPKSRMSIEAVMETPWFKRSLETPEFEYTGMFDSYSSSWAEKQGKPTSPDSITAFDIISLSSGLDLSGLFEATKRKARRFTARVTAEESLAKVKEVGEKMGYRVSRRKSGGYAVGLGRQGAVFVVAEAVEVAVDMVVVEVKVVEGEEEDDRWEELKAGLEEIVLSWHNDVTRELL